MGFGIVSSLSGAKARELQVEILANNIANMQTTGFKEQSLSFTAELEDGQSPGDDMATLHAPVKEGRTYLNFRQGSVYSTNNPLDLAIQGDGFFAVQTKDGIRYTRDGNFTLDRNGMLINNSGDAVLTDSGPLTIPSGGEINISTDGQITVGTEVVGKLRVADFTDKKDLKLEGNNYYSAEGLTPNDDAKYSVAQGHLESSNVNLVDNITRIIQTTRAYESLQKSVSQQIESSKLVNQLAKI